MNANLASKPAVRPRAIVRALAIAGVATHLGLTGMVPALALPPALPSGLQVGNGQATAVVNGNRMTVTNSANAVLNWQNFSVGAGNVVRFDQPDAASRVLNRVVGTDPSQIFGNISSNGAVWLVNPYGVLFGRDARVDVGSLVVSTLGVPVSDFAAGRAALSLTAASGAGAAPLVNQGELRAASGGRVWLVGGSGGVRNEGLIVAPGGQVTLAAGRSVDLVDEHLPNLAVRVSAPGSQVLNLGRIEAGAGRVDLMAAIVNQDGIVRADALGAGQGGSVQLLATEAVQAGAGSVTSASGGSGGPGGSGGQVSVDSGSAGTSMLSGEVLATGGVGGVGRGGTVTLLGQNVALAGTALVDVSGAGGGGQAFVGGGLQGRDTGLRNSQAVYFGPDARIRADATASGDGGRIILWSDRATRAFGSLSARGGAAGGDGGFIETSGGWLDARPLAVATDAPRGRAGQWLLDPNDIFINDQVLDTNVTGGPNFSTTDDAASLNTATIAAALLGGNNVTISTGSGGSNAQGGDINWGTSLMVLPLTAPVSLSLNAARNIALFQATIRTTGSALTLTLNAANGGTGTVLVEESLINTRGGNITLGGATQAVGPNITSPLAGAVARDGSFDFGVGIIGSNVLAGTGSIRMTGQSVRQDGNATGVFFRDSNSGIGTTVSARDIDIFGWVDSNADFVRRGVFVEGANTSITAQHSLKITGLANSGVFIGGNQGHEPLGVSLRLGTLAVQPPTADPLASLVLDGTSRDALVVAGAGAREGVSIDNPNSTNRNIIVSGGASVSIIGTKNTDPNSPNSLGIYDGPTLNFAGAGPVSISGNGRVVVDAVFTAPTGQAVTIAAGEAAIAVRQMSGDPSSLTITGKDVRLGADMQFGTTVAPTLTATATRDLFIDAPGIVSRALPFTMNFTAAAGGSGEGSLIVQGSTLASNGGNISLGGGSLAVGPNITSPRAGAVGTDTARLIYDAGLATSRAGVALFGANINAGSGTITMAGQGLSSAKDAFGVRIGSSVQFGSILNARDIDIFGWVDSNGAVVRAGVRVDPGSTVAATHALSIKGVANSGQFRLGNVEPIGVDNLGSLIVQPAAVDATASLTLTGSTNDAPRSATAPSRIGVASETAASSIKVGGGASVTITGTGNAANLDAAVRLDLGSFDFSSAGAVLVQGNTRVELGGAITAPSGQTMQVTSSNDVDLIGGVLTGSPSSVTLTAANLLVLGGTVNLGGAAPITVSAPEVEVGYLGTALTLSTGGVVSVFTNRYSTIQSSTMTSTAPGTAIVLAGFDRVSNIATLPVTPVVTNLVTPNGRWLFYAADDLFDAAGLSHDFREYGLTYPAATAGAGSGFAYSLAPVLTLSSAAAITRNYDGTTISSASGSSLGLAGLRSGQAVSGGIGAVTLSYPNPNVTPDVVMGVAGFTLPPIVDSLGKPVLGYGTVFDVHGAITARPVVLSGAVGTDKAYDGSLNAALSGGALANLVGAETLGIFYGGGLFSTPDVGAGKPVTATAALANGSGLASNYVLSNPAVASTAAITPRTLTLAGAAAADKVYDGNASALLSGGSLANLVAGETLGIVYGGGLFDTPNAGVGKPVTGTAALANGTGLASNYQLASASVVTAASVTQRPLSLSGAVAAGKVYDGGVAATLAGGALANLVAGETLGIAYSGGAFNTANVGAGKPVTASAGLLDGIGLAANYQLSNPAVATTASITQRTVALSGAVAADKVYDGSSAATLSGGTLANLVAGETLVVNYNAGLFSSPGVGAGKPVAATALLTDGSGLAANYVLASSAVASTASITPRTLTVNAAIAADKVYDGARNTTLSGGSLANLVAGETLAIVYGAALFDTQDVGNAKAVTGSAALANGTGQAANYQLAAAGAVASTAAVTPRTVILTGSTAANKVYDGNRSAVAAGGVLANLVGTETLTVSYSGGLFDTKDVAVNKAVTATAALGNGSGLASNYLLGSTAVATTASITRAQLSYVADPVTTPQGTLPAVLTGQVSGFAAAETVATATTGTLLFSTNVPATSIPGAYAINGSGLAAQNYSFTQDPGNATALTIVQPTTQPLATLELARLDQALSTEPPPLPAARSALQALDVTQAMRADADGGGFTFGALDLPALPRDEVAALLEARERYKHALFEKASQLLEADPTLADTPGCQRADQADAGRCLVTGDLLALIDAGNAPDVSAQAATAVGVPAPVAPAPSVPTQAPAQVPAQAPAAAPAATPAPAPQAAATPTAPTAGAAVPTPTAAAAVPTPTAAAAAPAQLRERPRAALTAPPIPPKRTVRTAAIPQIQRKLALLIGLDNYEDERIPSLENAGRDVEAMARVLEGSLGYQTVIVHDGSRQAIVSALNRIALTAQPTDSVVVYYAGHGTVLDESKLGYWIPASADADRPETWLSNNDIGKLLAAIRASQVVLISDSCFSGSLVSDRAVRAAAGNQDPRTLLTRRAAVVMSSGGNEPVSDGARDGHSPFAFSLMQQLGRLDSWRPGNNVFEQVKSDVTRRLPQVPRYGAARLSRHAEGADYLFEQRQLELGPQ